MMQRLLAVLIILAMLAACGDSYTNEAEHGAKCHDFRDDLPMEYESADERHDYQYDNRSRRRAKPFPQPTEDLFRKHRIAPHDVYQPRRCC